LRYCKVRATGAAASFALGTACEPWRVRVLIEDTATHNVLNKDAGAGQEE
jgi:hypothetical protein